MKILSPTSYIMNVIQGSSYKSMDMGCAEYPSMEQINKKGSGLPVRSHFRYSKDQKNILYGLFIKGQKIKTKANPEKAIAEFRNKLSVDQFVKPKQVRALFTQSESLAKKRKLNMDIPGRKKVEIMTTMEELENLTTQIYQNRQSVYAIHQMIKAIHVFFSYYQKGS